MTTFFQDFTLLLKLVLCCAFLYVWLPSRLVRFDKDANSFLDRVFIPLTHSILAVIVLVHLLVVLKLYETFSLALSTGFVFFVAYRFLHKDDFTKEFSRDAITVRTLNFLDSDPRDYLARFRVWLGGYLRSLAVEARGRLRYIFRCPFDGFLLLIPVAYAVFDRFSHAFSRYPYIYSDPYVHLKWIKLLGENQIYVDGVYPYGYEAILSAVSKLFFFDPAVVLRFIGSVAGCMIVLSIYFFLKKHVKSKFVIFICLTAYIISTELPIDVARQRAALPQEFAMIFFLPGIHYLNLFYQTKKRMYLLVAAEIIALAVLIHAYAAVFIAIGYVFVTLANLRTILHKDVFVPTASFMGAAGVLGVFPLLAARVLGMEFHASSIDFVRRNVFAQKPVVWYEQIFIYSEANPSLLLLLICVAGVLAGAVLYLLAVRKTQEEKHAVRLYAAIAVLGLFLYSQFRSPQLGFPGITEFSRSGIFLSVVAVTVYGFFMSFVDFTPLHKAAKITMQALMGVYLLLLVFNVENIAAEKDSTSEYNQAARAYYQIKEEFPALNWTIVSPVEQYSYSIGYGWHYNLWEFVAKAIEFPSDEFVFTTDNVFFFVEKIPLHTVKKVTPADAAKPFPAITRSYDEYYKNFQKRRVIEAKAYFWLEDYMRRKGGFSVYYEDEIFKIYHLVQDGMKPVNLVE